MPGCHSFDRGSRALASATLAEVRRGYVTRLTTQRLHQATFRQRVLRAYQQRFAHLPAEAPGAARRRAHPALRPPAWRAHRPERHGSLPAAPRRVRREHPRGPARPRDSEVRADILEEVDGPMLRHGLQEIAGQRLLVPRSERERPRGDLLEERYEMFRKAG